MARKENDEQTRLLRLLSKEEFQVEWPCQNYVMISMVERGLAKITGRFNARWGGSDHACARIAISEAGRDLLQNSTSS